ncbi:aliphatic sulfonates family ABC transporter periplasmic ligand-binding protein (plasmid) [Chondrocystis sp. NIES-4102]|nr:aliphatic sulfonates family ABC transporter periplasmic ligand-binding protein [Chondrocystis sp. NIES-4102]
MKIHKLSLSKKIWLIFVVLSLALILLINWQRITFWQQNSLQKNISIEKQQPIILGYSNWAGWWLWAIAEEENLFEKHGIDVELRWYDNYTESLNDLAAGIIDANSQALNDTIYYLNKSVKGEVVVLVNDNSAGNDKIIAVNIENVKQLKNQKVAVEAGVVGDFLLSLALEKVGLSRKTDIKILDIETGAAVEAFKSKQVNVVSTFAPFWLKALERPGANEIISSADFPGAIADVLVVTEEFNNIHPDKVQALVNTWFDILEFIKAHPQKADEIMSKVAQVSLEQMTLFKSGTKIFTLKDNIIAFSEGKDIKHLSYAAKKIINLLKENFDYNKIINSNFTELFDSKYILK